MVKKEGTINHRRHPVRSREISVFLLTILIMDVPGFLEISVLNVSVQAASLNQLQELLA